MRAGWRRPRRAWAWLGGVWGSLLLAAGCVPGDWIYSFVVIADTHAYGGAENDARLAACIDWVNQNREAEKIELVLLVGDIAWGTGQVDRVRGMLDGLAVPYVPVIGDNEIHNGDEVEVTSAWASHYEALAGILPGWRMGPRQVWNPQFGKWSYFTNFAFEHRDNHFLAMDWVSRLMDPIFGEQAELHDFEGGTFPWFTNEIAALAPTRLESVVMLSHHPMHQLAPGAFDATEIARVQEVTATRGDRVFADFAGHYHFNFQGVMAAGEYEYYITDATWDDDNTVRLVRVRDDASALHYEQALVVVP